MTTGQKAKELSKALGKHNAIYTAQEIISVLEDYEDTELAIEDWYQIIEIIENK